MGHARHVAVLLVATACASGPSSATPCSILCSTSGGCPAGLACGPDGYCHDEGDATDCSPVVEVPDATPSCGACDDPPAPDCRSACELAEFDPVGLCEAGRCQYGSVEPIVCPYGCDPATAQCRTAEAACADQICGASNSCGGTCTEGSGCCVSASENCSNDADDDCDGLKDCLDADCGPSPFCCVGTGLVHVISDGCMNDGGASNQGDSLLIYCCDSTVRVCLSGEACPWGGGCGGATTTCSRSGLPSDYMANAGCEQWRGRGNYYCSPYGEVYFP